MDVKSHDLPGTEVNVLDLSEKDASGSDLGAEVDVSAALTPSSLYA